jgi:hypothetical protein
VSLTFTFLEGQPPSLRRDLVGPYPCCQFDVPKRKPTPLVTILSWLFSCCIITFPSSNRFNINGIHRLELRQESQFLTWISRDISGVFPIRSLEISGSPGLRLGYAWARLQELGAPWALRLPRWQHATLAAGRSAEATLRRRRLARRVVKTWRRTARLARQVTPPCLSCLMVVEWWFTLRKTNIDLETEKINFDVLCLFSKNECCKSKNNKPLRLTKIDLGT